MIKELIIDLAYDKITLSQALTRSKLIANQIKNETFKNWLNKELNGYEYQDDDLPHYRKIYAEIILRVEFPFGRSQNVPVVLDDSWGEEMKELINNHRVIESIAIVEANLETFYEGKARINLPTPMVQIIAELYQESLSQNNGVIRSGKRILGKVQMQNILEQTKQKLLDTLQGLENEIPNLDKDYTPNEEKKGRVQSIVTNNIYGDNNPLNIVSGENIKQGDVKISVHNEQKEKLRSLGVEEDAIIEFEEIDKDHPKGNPSRQSKIMGWLGKVSASLTARGLYDKAPELIEYVGTLM